MLGILNRCLAVLSQNTGMSGYQGPWHGSGSAHYVSMDWCAGLIRGGRPSPRPLPDEGSSAIQKRIIAGRPPIHKMVEVLQWPGRRVG